MSDTRPDDADVVDDPDDVRDTPQTSANQQKTEPVPPSPVATAPDFAARSADRQAAPVDVAQKVTDPPVPSPGYIPDEHGHVAVSTKAAQGTSEELPAAEGISATALAQPGKPDGEVAT